jgi:hypothetical protein
MTICKTIVPFQKNKPYKKAEIIQDMGNQDQMATQYYDPSIKTLCSFYNENSGTWENVFNGGVFKYKRKSGGPLGFEIPAWEKTARRYVFFHRSADAPREWEYVGYVTGESLQGPDEWLEYTLLS